MNSGYVDLFISFDGAQKGSYLVTVKTKYKN